MKCNINWRILEPRPLLFWIMLSSGKKSSSNRYSICCCDRGRWSAEFPKGLGGECCFKHVKKMVLNYKLPQVYRFRQALELDPSERPTMLPDRSGRSGLPAIHRWEPQVFLREPYWPIRIFLEICCKSTRLDAASAGRTQGNGRHGFYPCTISFTDRNTLSFLRLGAENILITN